ncbi:MAG: hypothetical protein IKR63_02880 [Alloprevotella sp.]|nr:hypothetical protein [Alloprevotella sp.]
MKPTIPTVLCLSVLMAAVACKPSAPPATETATDGVPPASSRPAPTASERDDSTFADTTRADTLKVDTTATAEGAKAKAKTKQRNKR